MPQLNNDQPTNYSLAPYTGPWTKVEAAHLLRRTMFGPTHQQILDAVSNGMAATVTSLMQVTPASPPVAVFPEEAVVSQGTTWVNAVYPTDQALNQQTEDARIASLLGWSFENINQQGVSVTEKMIVFWMNHFGATMTFDSRANYQYLALLRQHALGDFKQLIKDITVNPVMLLFLNGATNTLYSPNENYSRELLELFSIGKGPQIGPGDYSNYTEDDVAAGAKILTGYLVNGLRSDSATAVTADFTAILHDISTKTLSYHFGGATITDAGPVEYANYIDVIFSHPDVAKHICRKLYRYFVNYDITATVESTVINDMATTLTSNGFSIGAVMQELLSSQHFYDVALRGSIIRNPLEVAFSMINCTGSAPSYDPATNAEMYLNIFWWCSALGMDMTEPPSVAGWTAYYQAPSFSQLWVNSTYLKNRFAVPYWWFYTGIDVNGNIWKMDVLNFLNNLSNPSSAPQVIDDICTVFFPKDVTITQKLTLKAILTNGLPDFEWTLQYGEYQANPTDPTYVDPVVLRIQLTLLQVFQMPEYQCI